jgi:hypothetical protein
MDPDATLAELIDAAIAGDWRSLEDHAENLAEWLKTGGFAPADPRKGER